MRELGATILAQTGRLQVRTEVWNYAKQKMKVTDPNYAVAYLLNSKKYLTPTDEKCLKDLKLDSDTTFFEKEVS